MNKIKASIKEKVKKGYYFYGCSGKTANKVTFEQGPPVRENRSHELIRRSVYLAGRTASTNALAKVLV